MSGHLGSCASALTRYADKRAATSNRCSIDTPSPQLALHVTWKNSADHICALSLFALLVSQLPKNETNKTIELVDVVSTRRLVLLRLQH